MSYEDELSQKQLKNLKRKIVSWVWECSPTSAIQFGLFCGIKVPMALLNKHMEQQSPENGEN